MVAWWPLDEDSSPSFDIVGGKNGSWINSPIPVTGKVDGAVRVPDKSHIEVSDAPELNFGKGDFSIDCWIKPTSEQRTRMFIDKRDGPNPAAGHGYGLYVTASGKLSMILGTGSSWNSYNSNLVVPTGEWSFVGAAVDRSDDVLILYVNGTCQSFNLSGFTSTVDSASNLFIGRDRFHYSYDSHNFSGDIDEVELYKRALDSQEFDVIFQADSYGKCKQECECGEWQGPGSSPGMQGDVQVTTDAYWPVPVGEPDGGTFTRYIDCGDTVTLGPPPQGVQGYTASVTLSSVITCEPENCEVTYTTEVIDPDGTPLDPSAYGTPNPHTVQLEYDPQELGTYTVVLSAACDGEECPACEVFVEIVGGACACSEDETGIVKMAGEEDDFDIDADTPAANPSQSLLNYLDSVKDPIEFVDFDAE